jgi:hypothetical protein
MDSMRLKLLYSPDEITNNLYTFGKEWMTTDNTEYIGLYHTYTTGEVFTEPTWNIKKSKQLIAYEDTTTTKYQYAQLKSINTSFISPTQYQAENSITQPNQSQLQRYFIQQKNDLTNIIEINSTQYEQYATGQIDSNIYTAVKITWWITGPVDDILINNTKQFGVITKNRQALLNVEKFMPGLSTKLSNLLEFYTDTDFVVPRDINLG